MSERSPHPLNILDLPHVALMEIFSKLTVVQRLRTEVVCKGWQEIVRENLRAERDFSMYWEYEG